MSSTSLPPSKNIRNMLEIATSYHERGYTVVPCHYPGEWDRLGDHEKKSPLVSWREWQVRRPTADQVAAWWRRWPQANIAIITGRPSGIIVLDVDGEEGRALLQGRYIPPTPTARTGGGGWHYYFRHPGGEVRNRVGILPHVDIRGDGGLVIAPPSVHPSGKRYEWVEGLSPEEVELHEMPDWIAELLASPKPANQPATSDFAVLFQGVPKGMRNDTCTRLAGHLLSRGISEEETTNLLLAWNLRNQPPMDEAEVRRVVASIARAERKKLEAGLLVSSAPKPSTEVVFPEASYVGIAADFAEAYSSRTEVPKAFLYMTFLAYLGGRVSHLVELNSVIRPQPRLYVVCLAPTGEKKSTALRLVDNFFRAAFPDWNLTIYGSGSFEGLAEMMTRDPRTKAVRPRILCFDELAAFVGKAKQEGSTLLPALCTLFETNCVDNITKDRKVLCRDAYVSLVAACSTETYEKMWTTQFLAMGFLNRLFLVVESTSRRVSLPGSVAPQDEQALATQLRDLVNWTEEEARKSGKLLLSLEGEALKLWDDYYQAMPRDIHSVRLDTYGFRLMTLLSLSKKEAVISPETVKQTTDILNYEYWVRRNNCPIDAETLFAKMEQKILRELEKRGPLKMRDLRRFTNAKSFGLWIFEQSLENLQRAGDVRFDGKTKTYCATGAGD